MQIPVTEIYIQMGNHEIKWVVNGFYEVFLCIKLFTYWVKYKFFIPYHTINIVKQLKLTQTL